MCAWRCWIATVFTHSIFRAATAIIGAGFISEILDRSVIDEVVRVSNQSAFDGARALARCEGIPAGISAGAGVTAVLTAGTRREFAGKNVVVLPDFAERYLSTALFDGL
jgi:cysteine synthase